MSDDKCPPHMPVAGTPIVLPDGSQIPRIICAKCHATLA